MRKLLNEIQEMLDKEDSSININPVLEEINKNRALGSANQCYNVMYKVAKFFNVKKVLEIGTHRGASAITFTQAILDNDLIPEVHTIDDWSQAELEEYTKGNFQAAGFKDFIIMHKGDSLKVVPELTREHDFDLAFIDGNHELKYTLADFDNVKDHTNLVLIHDSQDGEKPYVKHIKMSGFRTYNFPTHYWEGDGHLVGILLAVKR